MTASAQPSNPAQRCDVTNGSGLANADVSSITINCRTIRTIGGSVEGLSPSRFTSGVVLQNNSGDDLTVAVDGHFTFSSPVFDGDTFNVTVEVQPTKPAQDCVASANAGVVGGANVDTVVLRCLRAPPQMAFVANTIGTVSSYAAATNGELILNGFPFSSAALRDVVIDPSGQFVYLASELHGIFSFSSNGSNGTLNQIGVAVTGDGRASRRLLVEPKGRFAYAANGHGGATNQGSVSAFRIDASSGALTEIAGSPYTVNYGPSAIASDPSGAYIYVTCVGATSGISQVCAFRVDQSTGALTAMTGSPFAVPGHGPRAIAVHPSGRFAYVTTSVYFSTPPAVTAYAIDAATGALSQIPSSPLVTSSTLASIAIDPAGKFLFANGEVSSPDQNRIFGWSIDPSSGALSPLPGSPVADADHTRGVFIDATGRFLYATRGNGGAAIGEGSVFTYQIDASGLLSPVSSAAAAAGNFPVGFAIH